jgi:transposase-like protein
VKNGLLDEAGEAVAEVARTFGIDRATVYRLKP